MAQAVATTIYRKSIESHNTGSGTAAFVKSKVKDLEKMLWGEIGRASCRERV